MGAIGFAFGTLQAYLEIAESKIVKPPVPAEGFSIFVVSCLSNGGVAMEIGFEIFVIILLSLIGAIVQRIDKNVKTLLRDRE